MLILTVWFQMSFNIWGTFAQSAGVFIQSTVETIIVLQSAFENIYKSTEMFWGLDWEPSICGAALIWACDLLICS